MSAERTPLTPDDAERLLALPGAGERWSLLGGEQGGVLVVDLRGVDDAVEARCPGLAGRLFALPAVTVALVDDVFARPFAPSGLAEACDLHLEDPAALEAMEPAVAEFPLASLGLVQLLRMGAHLSLHDALVAESLVYSTLQAGPEFARWLEGRGPVKSRTEDGRPAVDVSIEDRRLRVRLDRPEKRNAFSAAMRDALCEALAIAEADSSLSVELSGRGLAFCSGGDLDEFGTLPDPATAHAIRATRNAARALTGLAERTTALVHGACVGAGAELAAFAGRVAALDDAFFELPELRLGLVPGAGGTASLPRRIGRQRTAWMALSGERVDATTALDWGLVDEIAIA